jgi:hypothetical protein
MADAMAPATDESAPSEPKSLDQAIDDLKI